jgi:hypothetical protein
MFPVLRIVLIVLIVLLGGAEVPAPPPQRD